MKVLRINRLRILLIFCLLSTAGWAQLLAPDTNYSPAVRNALAIYNATLGQQLHIYNGPEYNDYVHPFHEGQPYFLHDKWSIGTVRYDGNDYEDVSLLYNTVTDNLIILANNKVSRIQLLKDRVARFSLQGHNFIHLGTDSSVTGNLSPGFYDLLATGKVLLLARRTKNIQVDTKQTLEYNVLTKNHYFLKIDSVFYPVGTKKSFLKLFGDKRKELQRYMKQNKLNFRKDSEHAMIEIVRHYNQPY